MGARYDEDLELRKRIDAFESERAQLKSERAKLALDITRGDAKATKRAAAIRSRLDEIEEQHDTLTSARELLRPAVAAEDAQERADRKRGKYEAAKQIHDRVIAAAEKSDQLWSDVRAAWQDYLDACAALAATGMADDHACNGLIDPSRLTVARIASGLRTPQEQFVSPMTLTEAARGAAPPAPGSYAYNLIKS